MELFLDSSNPKRNPGGAAVGLACGRDQQSGPDLRGRADMEKTLVVRSRVDASPGPVFAQVIGWHDPVDDPPGAAACLLRPHHRQAARQRRGPAGAPAAQGKGSEPDLRLAVTAIASLAQAYLAGKAGADVAAIFNGPLDQAEDTAHDMIAPGAEDLRQLRLQDEESWRAALPAPLRRDRRGGGRYLHDADGVHAADLRASFTEARITGFLSSWRGDFRGQDVAGEGLSKQVDK